MTSTSPSAPAPSPGRAHAGSSRADWRPRLVEPGPRPDAAAVDRPTPPVLDVVVPVYNEQQMLETSVRRLRHHLDVTLPISAVVTIADNASTDETWTIAGHLADTLPGIRAIHLDERGRGRALRAAWSASDSDIVAYMDVDLSTDLRCLASLVSPIVAGRCDVAIGSRLAPGAMVERGLKREAISRTYNWIIHASMHNHFTDAQCGFKAVRRSTATRLLPLIQDNEWFFDTELLLLAEHHDLVIHEIPVAWVDDPDSRVHLAATALKDLRGLVRMARTFGPCPRTGSRLPADPPSRKASSVREGRTSQSGASGNQ